MAEHHQHGQKIPRLMTAGLHANDKPDFILGEMNGTEKVGIIESVDKLQCAKHLMEEIPNDVCLESSSNKHQITPLKTKSKTSRSENKEDVHSLSPTPVTPRSKLSRSQALSPCGSSLNSAYYIDDACSQDLPEVVWDYSSPKQSMKNERMILIDDVLQNMHCGNKASSDNSKTSRNLKLLEKWMEVRETSPASQREQRKTFRKGVSKKPLRHLMEEVEAVMNSIQTLDTPGNSGSSSNQDVDKVNNSLTKLQQQLESDCVIKETCNSLDSSDEMWGYDTDDDFIIVKATQEFELSQRDLNTKLVDQSCIFKALIPETAKRCKKFDSFSTNINSNNFKLNREAEPFFEKSLSCDSVKKGNDIGSCKKKVSVVCKNSTDSSWDPEFDNIWDDDTLESETLSQIPDDVLLGKITDSVGNSEACSNRNFETAGFKSEQSQQLSHKTESGVAKVYDCHSVASKTSKQITVSSDESFQELECDPFNDDFELNDPEFLTLLDKMESQSSLKCTPEEIAQKKKDALRRLEHYQKKSH